MADDNVHDCRGSRLVKTKKKIHTEMHYYNARSVINFSFIHKHSNMQDPGQWSSVKPADCWPARHRQGAFFFFFFPAALSWQRHLNGCKMAYLHLRYEK